MESITELTQLQIAEKKVANAKLEYAIALNTHYTNLYQNIKTSKTSNRSFNDLKVKEPKENGVIVEFWKNPNNASKVGDDINHLESYIQALQEFVKTNKIVFNHNDETTLNDEYSVIENAKVAYSAAQDELKRVQPELDDVQTKSSEGTDVILDVEVKQDTRGIADVSGNESNTVNITEAQVGAEESTHDAQNDFDNAQKQTQAPTTKPYAGNAVLLTGALLLAIGAAATLTAIYMPEHMPAIMSKLVDTLVALKDILMPVASVSVGVFVLGVAYESAVIHQKRTYSIANVSVFERVGKDVANAGDNAQNEATVDSNVNQAL